MYDEVSLQKVLDIIADWTPEERQMLRNKVHKPIYMQKDSAAAMICVFIVN